MTLGLSASLGGRAPLHATTTCRSGPKPCPLAVPRLPCLIRRGTPCRLAPQAQSGSTTSFGSQPPGGDGGSGGGGGGGDGQGGEGRDSSITAALLLAGKAATDRFPAEIAAAIRAGRISQEVLARYLDMLKNPFLSWLLSFPGARARLLADPNFLFKVGIELGIGLTMKLTAEYTKRGDEFQSQLDFVLANVIMALIADFMLVWLPAPAYNLTGAAPQATGALSRLFSGCPENAFQRVQPGNPRFSLLQRGGAVVRNGSKLAAVGFFASLLGVGVTNGMVALRTSLDPTFVPLNAPQDVLTMAGAYGLYMASSANLRYQVLAGLVEERGIETLFHGKPAVCAALSFAVRTGNTFLGSMLWVDFLRLLHLQPKASS
uniref:Protein RETICULATA-RELATED 4, chloroplastic n=2 Tax=Auxenochlorella protothecoides TaxID=3075 RepID=A0A1D1ZRF7_AUXPR